MTIDDRWTDGCSGFQWAEWFFPVQACCEEHDFGGTDGQLLDCLMAHTPGWAWPAVGLCVATMIFWRPIYRLIKPLLRRCF